MLWGTGIGQFFFSIRKQHTVNKGTRVQGNGSEYFRGVVFFYSFSIYCAAYHGIWCSANKKCSSGHWKKAILFFFQQPLLNFLHSREQSVVILNKLEIFSSLFNHHYGFQQP